MAPNEAATPSDSATPWDHPRTRRTVPPRRVAAPAVARETVTSPGK
jgi:hypothetical protein